MSGDPTESEFLELYFKHYDQIHRFVRKMLGGKRFDHADDLTQETFLKALLAFKSHDPDKNSQNWLYKIAKNTVIDFKRSRKNALNNSDQSDENDDPFKSIPDPKASAEEELIRSEKQKILQFIFDGLTEKEKQVCELTFIQGLKMRETADRLGTTMSAVKSTIHRARKTLFQEKERIREHEERECEGWDESGVPWVQPRGDLS